MFLWANITIMKVITFFFFTLALLALVLRKLFQKSERPVIDFSEALTHQPSGRGHRKKGMLGCLTSTLDSLQFTPPTFFSSSYSSRWAHFVIVHCFWHMSSNNSVEQESEWGERIVQRCSRCQLGKTKFICKLFSWGNPHHCGLNNKLATLEVDVKSARMCPAKTNLAWRNLKEVDMQQPFLIS